MIDTIIFDLDGTLIDSERVYFETYRRACLDFGGEIDLAFFKLLLGKPEAYDKQMLLERFGAQFPVEAVVQKHLQYSKQYFMDKGIPVKDDVLPLLSALNEKGYKLVVASSSRKERIQQVLEETGMDRYISHYVGGNEVDEGKPDPSIFLEAAKRVHSVPCACVVVEDSEAGIEAGYRAQMKVVAVPDLKYPEPEYERMADAVIASIGKLIKVLKQFQ